MVRLAIALALALASVSPALAQPKPRRTPTPAPAPPQEPEPDDESEVDDADAQAQPDSDDSGSEGGAVRLDDELDDVGPKVELTKEDLTVSKPAPAEEKNVAKLSTHALVFGRMGVDMIHDETFISDDGIVDNREDTFYFRLHGRAEGTGRFGRRAKVKVAGRFDAEVSFDQTTEFGIQRYEGRIWDTYADLYGKWFDLRFGNQLITWGYADLLSPNDVINPRDLRRGTLVPMDDVRIPILAAKATAYAGPLALQGVWVPVAPVSRFELLDGDYAVLGPNAVTAGERRIGAILKSLEDDPALATTLAPILAIGQRPDNGIETGEAGASLALRTERVDLATYFTWGHERTPRIRVAPELAEALMMTDPATLTAETFGMALADLAAMGIVPVEVDYPRLFHYGAALSGRLEPLGLKLEGAYVPEANTILVPREGGVLVGQSRSLPWVTVAGGVDYERESSINIIVEASYTRVLDVPLGAYVFRFDEDRLVTIGSRLEWAPGGGIFAVRFHGFVDVTSPSYAVMPSLRLSGHDNLSIEIGVGLYGGPANSLGGAFDRNDEVLLTIEYGL